jgi:hypothetical protein
MERKFVLGVDFTVENAIVKANDVSRGFSNG